MKVYLVISESVCCGESETVVSVHSTKKKAKDMFDTLVTDTKENDHLMEKDDVVVLEEEQQFIVYEDGRYSEDHYSVWTEEQEVR